MVTHVVREKLYKLDDIYNFHRVDKKNYAAEIIYACIKDFVKYWRDLEDRDFDGLRKVERDELYFFLNEKLYSICRTHLDLYFLTYDHDEKPMCRNGDEPEPFWQTGSRKKVRRKRKIIVTPRLNN